MKTLITTLVAISLLALAAARANQLPDTTVLGASAFVLVLAAWTAADYRRRGANKGGVTNNDGAAVPRPCAVRSACRQFSPPRSAAECAAANSINFRI